MKFPFAVFAWVVSLRLASFPLLIRGASWNDEKILTSNRRQLDESGDKWMSAWNERFERLNISHLRSPMFFQIDPKDRDGLLGFAHREEREGELREIKHVVGKGLSKHQRKQNLKNG